MNRTRCIAIAAVMLAGCAITTEETSKTTATLITGAAGDCYYSETIKDGERLATRRGVCRSPGFAQVVPRRVQVDDQMNALVVGISNFSPSANRKLTPAHAISAIVMSNTLRGARARGKRVGDLGMSASGWLYKFQDGTVHELATLNMAPGDRSVPVKDVVDGLRELDHAHYLPSPVYRHPDDEEWPYVQGEDITRAALMDAVDKHIARAQAAERGTGLVVFYIASHGVLSRQGSPYIFVHDSVENRVGTMIGYEEIVARYAAFARNKPSARVVLIFDTCQIRSELDAPEAAPSPQADLPPNVAVLSAASPGQYAWHWRVARAVRLMAYPSVAAPAAPTKAVDWYRASGPTASLDLGYQSQMSPIPIALAQVLRECESTEHDSDEVASLSLPAWLQASKDVAEKLLSEVPGTEEYAQTISISGFAAPRQSNLENSRSVFFCPMEGEI